MFVWAPHAYIGGSFFRKLQLSVWKVFTEKMTVFCQYLLCVKIQRKLYFFRGGYRPFSTSWVNNHMLPTSDQPLLNNVAPNLDLFLVLTLDQSFCPPLLNQVAPNSDHYVVLIIDQSLCGHLWSINWCLLLINQSVLSYDQTLGAHQWANDWCPPVIKHFVSTSDQTLSAHLCSSLCNHLWSITWCPPLINMSPSHYSIHSAPLGVFSRMR